MRAFLIQGRAGTGKTTLCGWIEKWLLGQGYTFVFDSREEEFPEYEYDFLAVYEKDGKRLLLNTWSDTKTSAEYLSKKYEEYKPFDTIITAIRPYDWNNRLHLWLKWTFISDITEDIIIDLDILRKQCEKPETFAKEVLEQEFIPQFLNN